jgi:uncharacterized protein (TIGR03067 family)
LPLAVPALLLLAPADAGPPAPGKAEAAELVRLKGAWKAVSLQVGKKAVQLRAAEWSITFAGDRWTKKTPEGSGVGKVRLDLAGRPPRMDLIGDKGATLFCTYRLDKGQLRLCWWPSAKVRQSTLDPEKQDPPGVLMVMEQPKDSGPVLDARWRASVLPTRRVFR